MRAIREKLVDYTESSDGTSEKCEINVVHDCNTYLPNTKDPMISGKLPADAQPSSDYEEQDQIPGKSEQKISEQLFSSDDENRTYPIVEEILSKLNEDKDKLVSTSMEAWQLENSDDLLTDVIHKLAVVVSETGENITTAPVEITSDTMYLSTAKSDSDSDAELVICQEKKEEVS